jgi:hypothetical protein
MQRGPDLAMARDRRFEFTLPPAGSLLRTSGQPHQVKQIEADGRIPERVTFDVAEGRKGPEAARVPFMDSNTRSSVRVCRRIETTDHHFQARGGGNVGGGIKGAPSAI